MDKVTNQKVIIELDLPDDKLWDDSISFSRQDNTLPDGRPLQSEFWGEYGYSFLTYTFPKKNLENASTDEIVTYLKEQRVNIDPARFPAGSIELMTSPIDPGLYNLTLTLTEGDD